MLENSSFSIFLPSSYHFILKHFSTNLNEAFCARCRNELLSEINRTIIFVFNIGRYLNLKIDLDLTRQVMLWLLLQGDVQQLHGLSLALTGEERSFPLAKMGQINYHGSS